MSTAAKKTTSIGEMTTLIASNAQTFEWSCFHFIGLVSTPLQIAISTYMLWKYLGVATFAGIFYEIFKESEL